MPDAPAIRVYNTLTHSIEDFVPLTPPTVRMYTCGPTVYDFAHIGNFRSFLFADVLRRLLELHGYDVMHVMNITDVGHMTEDELADGQGEDKMAVAAKRLREAKKAGTLPEGVTLENPDDPYAVANFYTQAFLEDARKLGLKVAEEYPQRMPHATQNVDAMLAMIRVLIDRGHAYQAEDGAVYYSVESFKDYGVLSGNSVENLRGGAGGRVDTTTQSVKRHPADFLLWKPDQKHIMKWPSPFGEGYPGWHIECSAMATRHLGAEQIDIHTGGEDNIFPHHECEIAQSRGATGKAHFARYWLHGRHLKVEGEKMSKSKGNFYTVRDVLEGKVTGREVAPAVLRYELIKTHYRASSNFTAQGLIDGGKAVARLQKLHDAAVQAADGDAKELDLTHPTLARFAKALGDDLNMSEALAAVFEWMNGLGEGVGEAAETLGVLRKIDSVLGVLSTQAELEAPDEAEDLAGQIDAARAAKDFAKADEIRSRLLEQGYKVLTTKDGTKVERPLA